MQKTTSLRKLPFPSSLGKGPGDGVKKRRSIFALLTCFYFDFGRVSGLAPTVLLVWVMDYGA